VVKHGSRRLQPTVGLQDVFCHVVTTQKAVGGVTSGEGSGGGLTGHRKAAPGDFDEVFAPESGDAHTLVQKDVPGLTAGPALISGLLYLKIFVDAGMTHGWLHAHGVIILSQPPPRSSVGSGLSGVILFESMRMDATGFSNRKELALASLWGMLRFVGKSGELTGIYAIVRPMSQTWLIRRGLGRLGLRLSSLGNSDERKSPGKLPS